VTSALTVLETDDQDMVALQNL